MRLFCLLLAASLTVSAADRKKAMTAVRAGVSTPGVQIPMSKLKAEAEIPVAGAKAILGITEGVWVGGSSGVVVIDAKTNKPGDSIAAVKQPCAGLAPAFESTWLADCASKSVVRLAAKTNESKASVHSGTASAVQGVAASEDSIWAFTDDRGTLTRIDPESNQVVAEMRLPAGCNSLLYAEKSLWATCPADDKLLRIDPLRNLVDQRVDVAAGPRSLVFAEGSLWVLGQKGGKVSRVDLKTNKVIATVDLQIPNAGGEITAGAGSIWVTANGFPLTRIDPQTDTVAQQFYGDGGGALRFGANALWLVNAKQGMVWRVDPRRVLATLAE